MWDSGGLWLCTEDFVQEISLQGTPIPSVLLWGLLFWLGLAPESCPQKRGICTQGQQGSSLGLEGGGVTWETEMLCSHCNWSLPEVRGP